MAELFYRILRLGAAEIGALCEPQSVRIWKYLVCDHKVIRGSVCLRLSPFGVQVSTIDPFGINTNNFISLLLQKWSSHER